MSCIQNDRIVLLVPLFAAIASCASAPPKPAIAPRPLYMLERTPAPAADDQSATASIALAIPDAPAHESTKAPKHTSAIDGAIGRSTQGAPIRATTIGDGHVRVYLIAGIHGNEREGLAVIDEAVEQWRDAYDARLATIRVLRDANPDGTNKRSRYNARGVELNRNFPASNHTASRRHGTAPLSETETRLVAADIQAFDPDLIIVLHSTHSGPFVDPDGPVQSERAAKAFVSAAREADRRWRVFANYANPDGSLGSFFGHDRDLPILTVEFKKGGGSSDAEALTAGVLAAIKALTTLRVVSAPTIRTHAE